VPIFHVKIRFDVQGCRALTLALARRCCYSRYTGSL